MQNFKYMCPFRFLHRKGAAMTVKTTYTFASGFILSKVRVPLNMQLNAMVFQALVLPSRSNAFRNQRPGEMKLSQTDHSKKRSVRCE